MFSGLPKQALDLPEIQVKNNKSISSDGKICS